MGLTDYQTKALQFDKQPTGMSRSVHAALGLAGEVGEVIELIKKDATGKRPLDRTRLVEEAGDVMWYLALLLADRNITFEEVCQHNIDKLTARYSTSTTT